MYIACFVEKFQAHFMCDVRKNVGFKLTYFCNIRTFYQSRFGIGMVLLILLLLLWLGLVWFGLLLVLFGLAWCILVRIGFD